ncbi:hypothetical protein [Marinobacter sp. bablab_jr008]|uniref:hypothetical protein n=1 Tax=Marinobacter sp. bablab_jr008 TaxID=2755064 RepID=UPI0018F14506|nr:hypothetical protein [Marinobacter sp. bablab_jr008]
MDALKSGMPDLSGLRIENRNWILESCDRSLGPRLTFRCMEREKAAFEAGMPDLLRLSQDQKRWLDESCSKSLGPSLYRSCIDRESSALLGGDSSPNQSTVENENSARTELDEKKWLCKAPFGGEVVVQLTYNREDGFVTVLDQEFEGRYRTEGLRRIWYFGEAEDSDSYRYSIVLDVRGIARFYDFSEVEEDGTVRSQETLKCVKN